MAAPLNLVTKKNQPFIWEAAQKAAWNALKSSLVSAPVLSHFNSNLSAKIEIDASLESVRAACTSGTGVKNILSRNPAAR